MRYLIGLLLLLSMLCSCQSSKRDKSVYHPVECAEFRLPLDTISLAECIANVSYIPLETPAEAFIYEADKVLVDDAYIYIADLRGDKIVVYDNEGKYLYCLDKKGNGPGEYLEMRNFTTDGERLYLIDNYHHKVFIYACKDGAFIGTKDMPLVADDLAYLADGKFLLGMMPMSERNMPHSNHLLFVVDADFQIIGRLLPYDPDERVPFAPLSFFTSDDDNVYFSSLFFDGFTAVPRSHPDNLYHIAVDFEKKIPADIRGNSNEIDKGGYQYLASTPVCCGNYWAADVLAGDYIQTCVYDRRRQRFMGNSETNAAGILFFPKAGYQGKFISYLADMEIYKELVSAGFPKADAKAEKSLMDEGAVLIVYAMK